MTKRSLAFKNVPWFRKGHPLFDRGKKPSHIYRWRNDHVNIGVASHRLYTDAEIKTWLKDYSEIGLQERAYAELWDFYNNGRVGTFSILNSIILTKSPISELIKNAKDVLLVETVCQSIIQWLGTNVGTCFINEAIKLAKMDRDRFLLEVDPERHAYEQELSKEAENVHKRLSKALDATVAALKAKHKQNITERLSDAFKMHGNHHLSILTTGYEKALMELVETFESRVKKEIRNAKARERYHAKKKRDKRVLRHGIGQRAIDV